MALPPPALAHRHSANFSLAACTFSFADFADAHSDWVTCYHAPRVNVHTCPQHCLRSVDLDPSHARVYGSGPYAAPSSICLAAIHSGVLDDAQGGAVHVDPFFPPDWSNSSSQTVFPGQSRQGSVRSGVNSSQVPADWIGPEPSPQSSKSWAVRGRGLAPRQRQTAPFSPRSGHVHAWLYPQLQLRANWSTGLSTSGQDVTFTQASLNYSLHLIVGGRNATHYLNDVWLFHSLTASAWDDASAVNRHNSRNGRWFRLPDAPFSPRADMQHHLALYPLPTPFGQSTPPADFVILALYGGETDYACGNRWLGVCSDEIWQLQVSRIAQAEEEGYDLPEIGLRFAWELSEHRLPPPRRCGFAPLFERRQGAGRYNAWATGIAGGQVSYDDPKCQADVVTLNDVWYGVWPYSNPLGRFTLRGSAPFSPRRSMQQDDALLSTDELVSVDEESPMDKSLTLTGGIRFLRHQFDAALNRSRMTEAELYADAWTCALFVNVTNLLTGCDWRYTYPVGVNSAAPASPSASLPLPLTQSASVYFPTGRDLLNMRLWGATSDAALRDLSHTPLSSVSSDARPPLVNVSLLAQPSAYRSRALADTGATGWGEVNASRYHLPLAYRLTAAELDDSPASTAALVRGSPLVFSHTLLYQRGAAKALFTSMGDGRGGNETGGSAWAAPLRRVGHAMASTWDSAIVSGGRSGSLSYNDWTTLEAAFCFFPDEPSYGAVLGAVRYLGEAVVHERSYQRYWAQPGQRSGDADSAVRPALLGAFRPGDEVEVACAPGWHFHPPLDAAEAVLTCAANSIWVDVPLGGVRRCVADALQCPHPLVDAGYLTCSEPLPSVEGVSAVTAMANRRGQPRSVDAATVADVPTPESVSFSGQLLLRVTGRWLTAPADVLVSAQPCRDVRLRNATTHCWLGEEGKAECRDFASELLCLMDPQVGVRDEVAVTTGRGSRRRTFTSVRLTGASGGREPLTVSVVEPSVVSLTTPSGLCNRSDGNSASLVDCAHEQGELAVQVCGTGFGYRQDETTAVTVAVNVSLGSAPLLCGQWAISKVDYSQCDPAVSSTVLCISLLFCGQCRVPPAISRQALLVVEHRLASGQVVSSRHQNGDESTAASIAFAGCAAGYQLARGVNGSDECQRCPPGTSTQGRSDAVCTACLPGYYSTADGVNCAMCPPGSYSEKSAGQCLPCEAYAWQPQSAQSDCRTCDTGLYRYLPAGAANNASTPTSSGSTLGDCAACPVGAECHADGNVTALRGYFVVVKDRERGLVDAVECGATSDCQGGHAPANALEPVPATGLAMVNACGPNRRPAYTPSDGSSNLLCAECEAEYTLVKGECVPCSGPSYGGLVLVALAAFALVFALHRITLHLSESATLTVMVYFVQMSALFLPADAALPLLGLFSVSFDDGVGGIRTCLLPLDDYGTIAVRLLSPVFAMLLLLLLLGMQMAARYCLRRPGVAGPGVERLRRAYDFLLPSSSVGVDEVQSPSDRALLFDLLSPQSREPKSDQQPSANALERPLLADAETSDAALQAPLWVQVPGVEEKQPLTFAPPEAERSSVEDSVADIARCYRRTWIRLALFSYNAIATVSVAYFHTRQVGEGQSRLWLYPTIDPRSSRYQQLEPLMIALLLVAVSCVPLLALYFLWLRRRSLREEGGGKLPSLFVMLSCSFQDRYWWMSAVVLARRLVLILLITFASNSVYTWLTAVNTSLLVLHVTTWPYRSRLDNRLEAVTLTALAAQTTYLSTWTTGRPAGADAVDLLLLLLPCAALAGLLVWHRFHAWKETSPAAAANSPLAAFLLAPFAWLTATSLNQS